MHKMNPHAALVQVIIIMLVVFSLSCSDNRQSSVAPESGKGGITDFTLIDLDGKKFTLSEQQGKPVLIIFSTTWCPTCRSEIPHYKKIHETYADQGLVIINIDILESQDKVSRFAGKYQLPYRVLLDETGGVAEAYRVAGVPAMILIDQSGALISRQYEEIDDLLKILLKGS